MCFYLTHEENGERRELLGFWEAPSPDVAVSRALTLARREDDGCWEAHAIVTDGEERRAG